MGSWTEQDPVSRGSVNGDDRPCRAAGVTAQVGRWRGSVAEVAKELGV